MYEDEDNSEEVYEQWKERIRSFLSIDKTDDEFENQAIEECPHLWAALCTVTECGLLRDNIYRLSVAQAMEIWQIVEKCRNGDFPIEFCL